MSWRKKVKEIAKSNPNALHPIFRHACATRGDKVWDKVSWQTKGEGDVAVDDAARPIRLVLHWLHLRDLLTEQGKAMLSASPESLALEPALVVPSAARFFDAHYEQWHAQYGINLVIEQSTSTIAEEALERAWLKESGDEIKTPPPKPGGSEPQA